MDIMRVLGFDSQEALKLGYFVKSVSQNNARGGGGLLKQQQR